MSGEEHHHPHKEGVRRNLTFAVLTVSSSRGLDRDTSGDLIEETVRRAGHEVSRRCAVPDDVVRIREAVRDLVSAKPDILVVDGGTGVTPKDVTVEAVRPLLDKEMPAFSTVFTLLSFEQIGPAAILSRACAGTLGGVAVFCIPGSSKACALALERIILPEASHLAAHVQGRV